MYVLLAAVVGCVPPASRPDSVIAIVDVAVVPMDAERILRNQTVVARDGFVTDLGPRSTVQVPEGARRIDGTGRYLLPGLVDFHVHLRDRTELLSYLAHGVTTVVHLSGPTGSIPDVVDLRRQVASGDVPGPTVLTSGRILDGNPPINPGVSDAIRTPEEARAVVAQQAAAGVDFIKVYNNLLGGALRAAIESAHGRGVAVLGHIPRADGRAVALQNALDAGLDVIAHGEEYFFTFFYRDVEPQLDSGRVPAVDETTVPEAVRLTKAAGAAVIPNLSFIAMTRSQLDDIDQVLGDPEARFLTPAVRDAWRRQNPTTRPDLDRFDRREQAKYPFVQKLVRALHAGGVPLLLGTDASAPGLFPGKAAHVELQELVKAGLTPYEALESGTSAAGEYLSRRTKSTAVGTIAVGRRADFMLVRQNPLEDVANAADLEGTVVRGRWFPRADLQRMREAAVPR